MAKKVFVSFDFDNDSGIKNFITGQAKLPISPFWCADWSMKEAVPQHRWEDEAEQRIKQCDIVLIMLGKETYRASGVLKEVAFARQYNKPIAQIIAYSDLVNPAPVANAGRLYRWSWDNLKTLLN